MLWTSAGPVVVIKYIVDQRRSDLAHQVCCGPAQVRFCSSFNMLWSSAGPGLAHQVCCGPAQVRFSSHHSICCGPVQVRVWPTKYAVDQHRPDFAHQVYCGPAQVRFSTPSMLWTSAGPLLLIKYAVDQRRSGFGLPSMLQTSAGPI